MDLSVRSDFLDREVRLAIKNGSQEVNTVRGSGYLLTSKETTAGSKNLVAYEIVILHNPTEKRAGALGSMVGNPRVLERAMRTGAAQFSPEKTLDIRIVNLEANTAGFWVLSLSGQELERPSAAMRSSSTFFSTSARKVQNTWPRMVSSSLWKIGRVANRCLAVRRSAPLSTAACSRAWPRAG